MSLLDKIPGLQRRSVVSQAFKAVYASPEGKLALDFLLEHCGVLSPVYEIGADAARLGFNAGKQFVGQEIARRIGMDEAAMIGLVQQQQASAMRRAADQMGEE